ncbi:hypothetical protein BGY98DRAFT_235462 [Russula aff. rugulosa BPL654]|nr:hypothetical protein BGY98DRAFT_235462 [Russula aff. rugulosa BPL654]
MSISGCSCLFDRPPVVTNFTPINCTFQPRRTGQHLLTMHRHRMSQHLRTLQGYWTCRHLRRTHGRTGCRPRTIRHRIYASHKIVRSDSPPHLASAYCSSCGNFSSASGASLSLHYFSVSAGRCVRTIAYRRDRHLRILPRRVRAFGKGEVLSQGYGEIILPA